MPREQHYLSPAEVVRRTRVSVRALKLYERRGLLAPVKTATGWRAYGPAQITRLNEIVALKAIGFSLAQIAELFAGRTGDLQAVLDAQASLLRERRAQADAALHLIETTQKQLRSGEGLPVMNLVDIIQEASMQTPAPQMKAYFAKLKSELSPDELARLYNGLNTSRSALVAELKQLAERQEDPGSAVAFDFFRRWSHLHRLQVGGDDALMAKAGAAWLEALEAPEAESDMPYGQVQVDYLKRIVLALRAEWTRLFAKVEGLAEAGADPASREALAVILRLRSLSMISRAHLSIAAREAQREAWRQDRTPLPGVTLSDQGMDFLRQAGDQATALLDAA